MIYEKVLTPFILEEVPEEETPENPEEKEEKEEGEEKEEKEGDDETT